MENVPYIVHEAAMARLERTIKRLWILCIIMFLYTRYSTKRSMDNRSYRGSYRRSMDGYSGNDEMVEQLRTMMDEVDDDGTRNDLRKLISKMERM